MRCLASIAQRHASGLEITAVLVRKCYCLITVTTQKKLEGPQLLRMALVSIHHHGTRQRNSGTTSQEQGNTELLLPKKCCKNFKNRKHIHVSKHAWGETSL